MDLYNYEGDDDGWGDEDGNQEYGEQEEERYDSLLQNQQTVRPFVE